MVELFSVLRWPLTLLRSTFFSAVCPIPPMRIGKSIVYQDSTGIGNYVIRSTFPLCRRITIVGWRKIRQKLPVNALESGSVVFASFSFRLYNAHSIISRDGFQSVLNSSSSYYKHHFYQNATVLWQFITNKKPHGSNSVLVRSILFYPIRCGTIRFSFFGRFISCRIVRLQYTNYADRTIGCNFAFSGPLACCLD